MHLKIKYVSGILLDYCYTFLLEDQAMDNLILPLIRDFPLAHLFPSTGMRKA